MLETNLNQNHLALAGKIAVLTGAAGEIGKTIAKRYLQEGATLIVTGRTYAKLESLIQNLISENPEYSKRVFAFEMDNADPGSVEVAVSKIHDRFGNIDILINNAGSAGPKQRIRDLPFSTAELATDTETVMDALGSLLLGPWLVTKAFASYFNNSASIINVSTIFSKTKYFGRAAYVVPKAALNALSKQMALEFGKDPRNIRVNIVYPGPVASERIEKVFAAMDKLQYEPEGTTYDLYTSKMLLRNEPLLIQKENIADTLVFLGSYSSAGFTAQDFEVTHGMQLPADQSLELCTMPDLSLLDMEGKNVCIVAQHASDLAQSIANEFKNAGANVIIDELPLGMFVDCVLVLPNSNLQDYGSSVLQIETQNVIKFVAGELQEMLRVAREIDLNYSGESPSVIFVSPDNNNAFTKILSAGVQELLRVWRQERDFDRKNNNVAHVGSLHQLIRYYNKTLYNTLLTSQLALWLANNSSNVEAIDVTLSPSLQQQQIYKQPKDIFAMRGLHLHKVALVTGGSEGIGAEIVRVLALSGAKVAVASRNTEKLAKLRHKIVDELRAAGYANPEQRLLTIANSDISEATTPQEIVATTITTFGRVDYLINNAGIAGEEQMVVDMSLHGWRKTIKANLISNYELILLLYPQMRERKCGHILNMSSHFGGVRHTTVVYPNRADYALSKTGQRILAENLAYFLGPEIQINAIAPGPVEGARIRGSAEREGLYQKRSRLILENKRLQKVYEWLIAQQDIVGLLYKLASNKISDLQGDAKFTTLLALVDCTEDDAASAKYLLDLNLAHKLINRLKLGLFVTKDFSESEFFKKFQAAPSESDFFSPRQINDGVEKIRNKMLNALALRRMPSNFDVAREVVYYLSNINVTGETLYPSCGLSFDQFVTETEWISDEHSEFSHDMNGNVIYIVGNALAREMLALISALLDQNVAKIVILVRDNDFLHKIQNGVPQSSKMHFRVLNDRNYIKSLENLPDLLNNLISEFGAPNALLSFPMSDLYSIINNVLPQIDQFQNLMDEHITLNFAIARRICLLDKCKMIIVTQRVPESKDRFKSPLQAMFESFFRNTLRTLTATVAKEANLLSHKPFFYQVEPNGKCEHLTAALLDLSGNGSENRYHSGMILKV